MSVHPVPREWAEGDAPPALRLAGVTKRYPGFALRDVDLELPPGRIMGLVGPNGAGKSTLIKIVLNLVRPDAGRVTVFGLDHREREPAVKSLVGYVPEENRLYEDLSGAWLARFVSRYYPAWDDRLFARLTAGFKVPVEKKVRELSKGNRMKLSVALALAHRPRLVLLDEPTSGVDPVTRHELMEELLEVIMDEERAVLFSSHITEDIEKVADTVTFLVDGRIALTGEKDAVTESWKRLAFRPADAAGAEAARGLFPYVVIRDGEVTAVTGSFTPEVLAAARELAAGPVRVQPMGLEEILLTLVREGE
ncbi:MAG: ATP-binding cassette domain-containing protein [Thermoanaerobacterales bacterium]|nr:ATP-binding cassette domain-containing protein [Bacillota bacterium]MDI6907256.1 ATP-binding cassette domain-containing protein [Thermoanaerobacterales bacterium]